MLHCTLGPIIQLKYEIRPHVLGLDSEPKKKKKKKKGIQYRTKDPYMLKGTLLGSNNSSSKEVFLRHHSEYTLHKHGPG